MRSGRAGSFVFYEELFFVKMIRIFKYLGNHFILNFRKSAGLIHAWITVLGDPELAEAFTVQITVGRSLPTKISHRGQVFAIDTKKNIMNETNGVLVFGAGGNNQALLKEEVSTEGSKRKYVSIFVEFLRPIIKEEKVDRPSWPKPCPFCNADFESPENLTTHLRVIHLL